MKNLMEKVPKSVEGLKIMFMSRMKSFFNKTKCINVSELNILLSDLFIKEMDCYIKSDCENIIPTVMEDYLMARSMELDGVKS